MKKPRKNWLEWTVFGFSAALIAAVLAFLIYESATLGDALPDIQLSLGTPQARSNYFAVPIVVTNKGDQTAAGVHLEVVLKIADMPEERADLEIPFVPRRAEREAWVTFRSDPAKGALEGRVLGYEKP